MQAVAGFFKLKFEAFDLGAHLIPDSGRTPRRLLHRRGPRAANCSGGLHPVWVATDKSARRYLVPERDPPGCWHIRGRRRAG